MTQTDRPSLDLYLLVARILLVAMFPISGWAKVAAWPGIVTMLTTAGAPLPLLGGYLAVFAELVFPALVVIGLFTRWAAFGLALYTLGTIIIAHRFWEFSGAAQFGQIMSFFKNISVIIGLGFIMQFGPGRYAFKP